MKTNPLKPYDFVHQASYNDLAILISTTEKIDLAWLITATEHIPNVVFSRRSTEETLKPYESYIAWAVKLNNEPYFYGDSLALALLRAYVYHRQILEFDELGEDNDTT